MYVTTTSLTHTLITICLENYNERILIASKVIGGIFIRKGALFFVSHLEVADRFGMDRPHTSYTLTVQFVFVILVVVIVSGDFNSN